MGCLSCVTSNVTSCFHTGLRAFRVEDEGLDVGSPLGFADVTVLALDLLPLGSASDFGTAVPLASATSAPMGSLPMNSFLSKETTAYGAERDEDPTAKFLASMSLMLRCPRGAAVFRVAVEEDADVDAESGRNFVGGSFIVKSGAAVERDVVGMADWVEMVPPGVSRPDGVVGTPSDDTLLPLALLRCAEGVTPGAEGAGGCKEPYESNGLYSSALEDGV